MRTLVFDELTFSAAHYIAEHPKCCRIHGHTYFVRNMEVVCSKFVDIGEIKSTIKGWDHVIIIPRDDVETWHDISINFHAFSVATRAVDGSPTVEDISEEIARDILAIDGVEDVTFELYEGPNQGVAYP